MQFGHLKRREFMSLLGGTGAAWPLHARAQQQPAKPPTVGFLSPNAPLAQSQWTAAFVQRLRELGWIEGRTVAIEYRWAEGQIERLGQIASELVQAKVDVIVTAGTPAIAAARQATALIPVVFALSGDPVGSGAVAALARPGGNVTGLSLQVTDTAGKRLELLREVVPGFRRLAILGNVGFHEAVLDMDQVKAMASSLGLEVTTLEIRRAEDIDPTFQALKDRTEALYISGDPLVNTNRIRINTWSLTARLPTMH